MSVHTCKGCALPVYKSLSVAEKIDWAKTYCSGYCYLNIFNNELKEIVIHWLGAWPTIGEINKVIKFLNMDETRNVHLEAISCGVDRVHIVYNPSVLVPIFKLLSMKSTIKVGGTVTKSKLFNMFNILVILFLFLNVVYCNIFENKLLRDIKYCETNYIYPKANYYDCSNLCNKEGSLKAIHNNILELNNKYDIGNVQHLPFMFYNIVRLKGSFPEYGSKYSYLDCDNLMNSIAEVMKSDYYGDGAKQHFNTGVSVEVCVDDKDEYFKCKASITDYFGSINNNILLFKNYAYAITKNLSTNIIDGSLSILDSINFSKYFIITNGKRDKIIKSLNKSVFINLLFNTFTVRYGENTIQFYKNTSKINIETFVSDPRLPQERIRINYIDLNSSFYVNLISNCEMRNKSVYIKITFVNEYYIDIGFNCIVNDLLSMEFDDKQQYSYKNLWGYIDNYIVIYYYTYDLFNYFIYMRTLPIILFSIIRIFTILCIIYFCLILYNKYKKGKSYENDYQWFSLKYYFGFYTNEYSYGDYLIDNNKLSTTLATPIFNVKRFRSEINKCYQLIIPYELTMKITAELQDKATCADLYNQMINNGYKENTVFRHIEYIERNNIGHLIYNRGFCMHISLIKDKGSMPIRLETPVTEQRFTFIPMLFYAFLTFTFIIYSLLLYLDLGVLLTSVLLFLILWLFLKFRHYFLEIFYCLDIMAFEPTKRVLNKERFNYNDSFNYKYQDIRELMDTPTDYTIVVKHIYNDVDSSDSQNESIKGTYVTEYYKKQAVHVSKYIDNDMLRHLEKEMHMQLINDVDSMSPHHVNEAIRFVGNELIKRDIPQGSRVLIIGSSVLGWPVSGYMHSLPNLETKDKVRINKKLNYINNLMNNGTLVEYTHKPLQQIDAKYTTAVFVHSAYNIPFDKLFFHCYRLQIKTIYISVHINPEMLNKTEGVLLYADMSWEKFINCNNEKFIKFIHLKQNENIIVHDWNNLKKLIFNDQIKVQYNKCYGRTIFYTLPDTIIFKYTLNDFINEDTSVMSITNYRPYYYKRLNIFNYKWFSMYHKVVYISNIAYEYIGSMVERDPDIKLNLLINDFAEQQRIWKETKEFGFTSHITGKVLNIEEIVEQLIYYHKIKIEKNNIFSIHLIIRALYYYLSKDFISNMAKMHLCECIIDNDVIHQIDLKTVSIEYLCKNIISDEGIVSLNSIINKSFMEIISNDYLLLINKANYYVRLNKLSSIIFTDHINVDKVLPTLWKQCKLLEKYKIAIYSKITLYTNCHNENADFDIVLHYDDVTHKLCRINLSNIDNLKTIYANIKQFNTSVNIFDAIMILKGNGRSMTSPKCFKNLMKIIDTNNTLNEDYTIDDIIDTCKSYEICILYKSQIYTNNAIKLKNSNDLETKDENLKKYVLRKKKNLKPRTNTYDVKIRFENKELLFVVVTNNHCFLINSCDAIEKNLAECEIVDIDYWNKDIQGEVTRSERLIKFRSSLNDFNLTDYTRSIKEILEYTINMELTLIEKYKGLQTKSNAYLITLTDVFVYNCQSNKFINKTPEKVYEYGWNGSEFVSITYDARNDTYTCLNQNKYILISDDIQFIRERDVLNNIMPKINSIMEYNYSQIKMVKIEGVPGCGKTTYIKSLVNEYNDLVCTATCSGLRDYRKSSARFRTYDSVLINNSPEAEVTYCDEAFMVHPGDLYMVGCISNCKSMIMVGDTKQIPFISRSLTMKFEYNTLIDIKDNKNLNVTYRCPQSMISILLNFYPNIKSKSNFIGNITMTKIMGIVQNLNHEIILTFTQYEKHELKKFYNNVNTIHEVQGKTFKDVAIYRFRIQDSFIYTSYPHLIVSITRHQRSISYYYVKEDILYNLLNNKDIVITDYNRQPYIYTMTNNDNLMPTVVRKKIVLKHYKDKFIINKILKPYNLPGSYSLTYSYTTYFVLYKNLNYYNNFYMDIQSVIDKIYYRPYYYVQKKLANENLLKLVGNNIYFNNAKYIINEYKRTRKKFIYCESRLMTPQPLPLKNTLNEVLYAIYNRNLNPPYVHLMQPINLAFEVAEAFMNTYIDKSKLIISLDRHKYSNGIYLNEWLRNKDECYIGSLKGNFDKYFNHNTYYCHIKPDVKPKLDNTHNKELQAGQVITAHSPNVTAFFANYFMCFSYILKESLYDCWIINDGICLNELNGRFNKLLYNIKTFKAMEIDFSKFDKSQESFCLEIQLHILKFLYMPEHIINLWWNCHRTNKLVFNNGITLITHNQRRSGDIFTFMGNTIINMAALNFVYNLKNSYGGCFAGDDSLIILPTNYIIVDKSKELSDTFNLIAKIETYLNSLYFCSKFVIYVDRRWYFIPDPLKLLVRLGRNNIVNKLHCEEYYISFQDYTYFTHIKSFYLVIYNNLVDRYGYKSRFFLSKADVDIILRFLHRLSLDKRSFLSIFDANKKQWLNNKMYKKEYKTTNINKLSFKII